MVKCTHPLCGKSFKSIKALNMHIAKAHPTWSRLGGKRKKKK